MTATALNPRVGGALTRYRVMAIITGTFLIAVFAGFILKPILNVEEGSSFDSITTFIAIAHGWIYMVYLAATIHLLAPHALGIWAPRRDGARRHCAISVVCA